jgi:hypothetical protein
VPARFTWPLFASVKQGFVVFVVAAELAHAALRIDADLRPGLSGSVDLVEAREPGAGCAAAGAAAGIGLRGLHARRLAGFWLQGTGPWSGAAVPVVSGRSRS